MKMTDTLLSGLIGTSGMTMFSYLISDIKDKNFKEPELLAALLDDWLPAKEKRFSLPLGWISHASLGVAWAFAFRVFYETTDSRPTIKNGLILGGISGLTAVAIWKLTFNNHPNPPQIPFRKYYAHLFLAHLVYSLSVTLSLQKNNYLRRGSETHLRASSN